MQPLYSVAALPLALLLPPGSIICHWVQKSISHRKKCPSRAQPPCYFRGTIHRLHGRRLSLAQGQHRCARSNLYALPRRLGAMMMQGVWTFVQKLKNEVMRAVDVYCRSTFCPKKCYLNGNFLIRLGQPFPPFDVRNCHLISDSA